MGRFLWSHRAKKPFKTLKGSSSRVKMKSLTFWRGREIGPLVPGENGPSPLILPSAPREALNDASQPQEEIITRPGMRAGPVGEGGF